MSFSRAVPARPGLGAHTALSSLHHELSPGVPRRILAGTSIPASCWKVSDLRGERKERLWGQHQPDPAAVSGSGVGLQPLTLRLLLLPSPQST